MTRVSQIKTWKEVHFVLWESQTIICCWLWRVLFSVDRFWKEQQVRDQKQPWTKTLHCCWKLVCTSPYLYLHCVYFTVFNCFLLAQSSWELLKTKTDMQLSIGDRLENHYLSFIKCIHCRRKPEWAPPKGQELSLNFFYQLLVVTLQQVSFISMPPFT